MKFSLNWIKDYLAIDENKTPIAQIVNLLRKSTAETTNFEQTGAHLKDIFSAKIIKIEPHPNADKLSLVTIESFENIEVVCGAKNFKLNDIVCYARLGAKLPDGLVIKEAKIRGHISNGMLCSGQELMLSDDHDGLFILDQKTKAGVALSELFADSMDYIFELDNQSITNRPDLWSHFGLARELSTLLDLQPPELKFKQKINFSKDKPAVNFDIKNKNLVPRLSVQALNNVNVEASPFWLQQRLFRVGSRAINNIVDITNYVMFDIGQPMHAFDIDKISKSIEIKLSAPGTKFINLYQNEIALTSNDLAFYDGGKALSLAGIIGGLNSGIDNKSKNILFEAGNWDATQVRLSAVNHKLKTDAAQRFEKSIDPNLTILAISKAWDLLLETNPNAKIYGGLFDEINYQADKIFIEYSAGFTNEKLGIEIPESVQKSILIKLGFKVTDKNNKWLVEVPSYRATKDINIAEDLVEEIGRVYGYDKISPIAPLFPVVPPNINKIRQQEKAIKNFLISNSFVEIYNSPFSNIDEQLDFNFGQTAIEIKNAANAEQTILKTNLLPHMLNVLHTSQIKTFYNSPVKLFELAKVYNKEKDEFLERRQILIALSEDNITTAFRKMQSYLQAIAVILEFNSFSLIKKEILKNEDPNYSAEIHFQSEYRGRIFKLTSHLDNKYKIKNTIFALIELDRLPKSKSKFQYIEQSKYPAVFFDISILAPLDGQFAFYKETILKFHKDIFDVVFKDRFFDEKNNLVSLTITIVFKSEIKTFSGDEVSSLQKLVVDNLAKKDIKIKSS